MTGRPPLYAVERVPVLQNRVFATAAEARDFGLVDTVVEQRPLSPSSESPKA